MNSALLLILTPPNGLYHFIVIAARNTQNKFQNFLPHRMEDMRVTILVKNSKIWVFSYTLNTILVKVGHMIGQS